MGTSASYCIAPQGVKNLRCASDELNMTIMQMTDEWAVFINLVQ
jgi:hypothetical protein